MSRRSQETIGLSVDIPAMTESSAFQNGPRLQKVQPVSSPQAFAFKSRRVGCWGVEKYPIKTGVQGDCCELFLHESPRLS